MRLASFFNPPRFLVATVPLLQIIFFIAGCTVQNGPIKPSKETADQTSKAEQNLRSAQQRELRYQEALALLEDQRLQEAESKFQAFVAQHPEFPGAYLNLAYITRDQQNLDASLLWVDRCLEIDDQIAEAYNHRAQLKLAKGEVHDALQDYRTALSIRNDYLNAHYNLALLYDVYLQDIVASVKHYQAYLDLLPQDDERTREWVQYLNNSIKNAQ